MSDVESIKKLVAEVQTAAVARVLRQVGHDLATPVSTLTMDLLSAQMIITQLHRSANAAQLTEKDAALSELTDICSNLERASANLAEYIAVLFRLANDDKSHATP